MLRAEDLTPADLFQVIWRQRYALVGFALAGAAIAYGYSLFVPDRYTAETLVLVEDEELPRAYVQSTSTLSLRARLDTLREQVLSRTRLEQLVQEYELADPGGPLDQAVARVRRRIAIDLIGRDGFRLKFTDEDPRMAARVANALAGLFIAESADAVQQQVRNTASGIQQQAEELRIRLDAQEQELASFKAANVFALPNQLSDNLDMLQALPQRLRDNDGRLSAARVQLAALPDEPESSTEIIQTVSAREAARQILAVNLTEEAVASRLASEHPLVQLAARRLQRQSLLRRYTERHPDVRALLAEIADLERQAAIAGPYVPDPSDKPPSPALTSRGDANGPLPGAGRAALELEIRQRVAEHAALTSDLTEYQGRVDRAPAVERRLRELERTRDNLARNYDDLASRTVEADLASDLRNADASLSSYRVVDLAVVPGDPSSPLRVLFLLGGAIAGIGLVGGAIFLREMVLEPVNSASEIERFTDLDVLASIPLVRTPKFLRRQRLVRVGSVAAVGAVLVIVFVLRVMMRGM